MTEDITGFHDHSLASIGVFEVFNNSVFCSMEWLDPHFRFSSVDYGRHKHLTLYSHFKNVLDEAGFDPTKVGKE